MAPMGPDPMLAGDSKPWPSTKAPMGVAMQGVAFRVNPAQTRGAFAAQVVLTVLVSVGLFMLFIMAFFFLLTRKVEKRIVSTSVERVVDTLSQELRALVTPAQAETLGAVLQGVQAPDTRQEDAAVEANNAKLVKKAGLTLGITAGVIIVVAVGVFMGMKAKRAAGGPGTDNYPNPVKVLLCATFGFAAVALCEVVFLFGVAGRYQPLDTAATRKQLLTSLIQGIEALPQDQQ